VADRRRDALLTDLRPLELGSDHQVFEAFGVPMVYFHDWPDVTIHTNKDVPDNLDATKLGRVAYMTAGIVWTLAALPDADAARLVAFERVPPTSGWRSRAAPHSPAGGAPTTRGSPSARRSRPAPRSSRTIAALWPATAGDVRRAGAATTALLASLPRARPAGPRDAPRAGANAGSARPIDVYYYDHLAAVLGDAAGPPPALGKRDVFALTRRSTWSTASGRCPTSATCSRAATARFRSPRSPSGSTCSPGPAW